MARRQDLSSIEHYRVKLYISKEYIMLFTHEYTKGVMDGMVANASRYYQSQNRGQAPKWLLLGLEKIN